MRWLSKQIELFKLAGIPIRIDYSWFIILFIYTWTISSVYLPSMAPKMSVPVYWLLGLATTMLVFISVLIHELAHAFTARRHDIEIRGITLYIFGGLAHLEREPQTPGAEFYVAFAGPAASLLLGLIFYLLSAAFLRGINSPGLAKAMLHLGTVNLILACFNLLPGFPMDGGRILRAIIWKQNKNYEAATRASLKSGATIAISLICVGVMTLFIQHDFLTGIWAIITGLLLVRMLHGIGPEILRGVKSMPVGDKISSAKKSPARATVSEAMQDSFTSARPDMLASEFIAKARANNHENINLIYPVVYERRLHGMLKSIDVESLTADQRERALVREVMLPVMSEHFVARDLPLEEAAARLAMNGCGHAAVLDNEGFVVGYLSLKDLERKKV